MNPVRNECKVIYELDNNSRKIYEKSNTIGSLTPLTATKNDCYSGWIRAVNNVAGLVHAKGEELTYSTAEKLGLQGKWIITFKKNDPNIVNIWEKVRTAVKDCLFCEAKVSIPNDNFQEQVILIYTYNHINKKDVKVRLKNIIDRGIISNNDNIYYKKESATLAGKDKYKYSSKELLSKYKISSLAYTALRIIKNNFNSLSAKFNSLFSKNN